MTQAAGQMDEAANQLKPGKWQDALPIEQRALQSLLRAESMFRDIQIAFGQRGGGAGGGGAQRDLARMFDLELDTSKNQYETGQQDQQQQQSDQQKAVDAALEKLKELARRQQELAAQRAQQQAFEQRWQEEQLRREAEELRRQMQEMAQNQQAQSAQQESQQQQSGQQSSSGQSSSGRQSAQNGQSGQNSQQQRRQMSEALRQSTEALRRSEEEMRKAVSDRDPGAQRRAAENLAQAQSLLGGAMQKQSDNAVAGLSQKAQEMANAQRDIANSLKHMYGEQQSSPYRRMRPGQTEPGSEDMPEMKDPATRRYYTYDRRNWEPEPPPPHLPDAEERAIADEKARLAKEMQQLQSDMQKQERSMASTEPGASSKMRKALSDAEQKELAMRMQKTAEWMRQGYGERNLGVEESMAAGMEQLSRDLQDVQKALKNGDPNGKNQQGDRNAEALSEVRNLRQMLEVAQNAGAQNARAQQQAQRQGYQQQALSRDSQGQQQGGQPQNGQQQGQQGGQNQANQYSPNGGPGVAAMDDLSVRNAIGDLNSLRGRIDPHDRALRGYVDDTIGSLRLLNADPNVLQSTIGQDAVTRLERLEVELARRAGDLQQLEGARLRAPEDSPEKYKDAVAEYFKKLSQAKR
jgi:hypothetical protein